MSPRRHDVPAPPATTIFSEMTALAAATGAINLGQGFPDTDGPDEVLAATVRALMDGQNQYPPGRGTPHLVDAIVAHQRRWYGMELDAATQVLVTMGATEGISASILALVRPGDEVVMFEPYFDSYAAMVEMAGGVRRPVPLRFPDYLLDETALQAVITDRTTMLIINTPHNPTGKVFTREELEIVAAVAREHDLVVLSDEVYEHLVFDGAEHVPTATVSDLAARTLTVSSGGKTFNTTGWKIGWVTGPADLIALVAGAKQFLTFSGGAPLQAGIAAGLSLPDAFFTHLRTSMATRRDLLTDGLRRAGFTVSVPAGGYFVLADAAPLGVVQARQFALDLPTSAGVVGVPAAAFCDDPDAAQMNSVMRFAFCKQPATIEAAVERLVSAFAGRAVSNRDR